MLSYVITFCKLSEHEQLRVVSLKKDSVIDFYVFSVESVAPRSALVWCWMTPVVAGFVGNHDSTSNRVSLCAWTGEALCAGSWDTDQTSSLSTAGHWGPGSAEAISHLIRDMGTACLHPGRLEENLVGSPEVHSLGCGSGRRRSSALGSCCAQGPPTSGFVMLQSLMRRLQSTEPSTLSF